MSGGSYHYLYCYVDEGALELLKRQDDVQAMYERLCQLEYAHSAAKETKSLLADLEQLKQTIANLEAKIETKSKNLANVWIKVEMWDSRDESEEEVKKAIAEFQPQ